MKYLRKLELRLVPGTFTNPIKGQVHEPAQVFSVFKDIKDWSKETLIGIFLSPSLEMNSYAILSVGGESMALVIPEEIFQNAILTRSPYFILIHNHPSGQAAPSGADHEVMQVLRQQSEVMNRIFLDFIIVGDNCYWSMFEEDEGEGGSYTLGGFK